MRAITIDDEAALHLALQAAFPQTARLEDYVHFTRNLRRPCGTCQRRSGGTSLSEWKPS